MGKIKSSKVVSTLPTPLDADTAYFVRVGAGFDLYMSDIMGNTAHKINASSAVYQASTTPHQLTASHTYNAWPRVDGTGYLAQRRDLLTGDAAGEFAGSLPIPADLTTLTYS